jgi:RNA polymerase sigma factor (TIGR02999 family)
MTPATSRTVDLIRQAGSGNRAAAARLFERVYDTLRSIAAGYMQNERAGHTLEAAAVVNEAFLRLFGGSAKLNIQDRAEFFRVAACVMRRVLVDHARGARAQKRNGGHAVTLREWMLVLDQDIARRLDAEAAMARLRQLDPRQEEIVSLHIYSGRSPAEIAELFGVSTRTVQREIKSALVLLRHEACRNVPA